MRRLRRHRPQTLWRFKNAQHFRKPSPALPLHAVSTPLKSIVQNNTLWGTYFEDLNDAAEFRRLRTPLAHELGERFIPAVEAFAKRGTWEADTVRRSGDVTNSARTDRQAADGHISPKPPSGCRFGTAFIRVS